MSTILEWIDLDRRQFGWTRAGAQQGVGGDLSAVVRTLRTLGIARIEPVQERPPRVLDHRWRIEDGDIHYDARFLGQDREPSRIAFYVVAVLATVGAGDTRALHALRVALYEILVNVYEHGRSLPGTEPEVRLRLRIGAESVEGTIEDGCEEFAPDFSTPVDLDAKVRGRAPRGYGVTLIQRALDSVQHEFGETGNTIHFRKGVTPMARASKALPEHFCIDRIAGDDDHMRWILRGSLDADAAPGVVEVFQQALNAGETKVELDLENVGMISSAGVGSLIAGVGEFRDEGGTIRVAALSDAVHHVFAMLDLLDYFECPQLER